MEKRGQKKSELGEPKQVRFPRDLERQIQAIADENAIEWAAAARMAIRFGVPELRKRLIEAAKAA